MLQVAHLCKDVVLCVVYEIRDASLLLVLILDRGGVLRHVAHWVSWRLIWFASKIPVIEICLATCVVQYSLNLMMSFTVSDAWINNVASSRHPSYMKRSLSCGAPLSPQMRSASRRRCLNHSSTSCICPCAWHPWDPVANSRLSSGQRRQVNAWRTGGQTRCWSNR